MVLFLIGISLILLSSNSFPHVYAADSLPKSATPDLVTHSVVEKKLTEERDKKLVELEQQRLLATLQEQTNKLEVLLQRYNSPFAGLGYIIVHRAYECGGDYRLLSAIAGNESGFGRIPYKLYNPFGYLNDTQYSSWEEALYILSCEISQKHLAPCNNDPACVVVRYGGSDTNKPKWVSNITWFMGQL